MDASHRSNRWGLDEVLEAIGLFYLLLIGWLMLSVTMERGLTETPKPHLAGA